MAPSMRTGALQAITLVRMESVCGSIDLHYSHLKVTTRGIMNNPTSVPMRLIDADRSLLDLHLLLLVLLAH